MTTKILALDASTDACSAALLMNDKLIERYQLEPRQHAQLILPMIQSLLAEAELKLSQLDTIAYGCGPGSFTGIRIAAGVVQGIAFAVELPVIPISSLRALAQGVYEDLAAEKVLVGFDARMQEVYWGVYQLGENGLMQPVLEDRLSRPEQIPIPETNNWIGAGNAWREYNDILQKRLTLKVTEIESHRYPQARDVVKLALTDYVTGKTIIPEQALPQYLRGEKAWKKNLI